MHLRFTCHILILAALATPAWSAAPTSAPSRPLTLTVRTANGSPAAGAKAVLVPEDRVLEVTDGRMFDADPTYTHAIADANGRFTFAAVRVPYLVCVIDDQGCVSFDDREVPADGVVRLAAWASVRGRVRVGDKPLAGQNVLVRSDARRFEEDDTGPTRPRVQYRSEVVTDAAGRYAVERMAPGTVSAVAPRPLKDHRRMAYHPTVYADAPAGGAVTLDIGGVGRAVVGRMAVPDAVVSGQPFTVDFGTLRPVLPPAEPDPATPAGTVAEIAAWAKRPEVIALRRKQFDHSIARMRRLLADKREFDVAADGSYRIEDVPPGRYTVTAYVATPFLPGGGSRRQLGEVAQAIEVPAGDAAAPFDEGLATAIAVEPPGSRPAPPFDVPGLDDKPVRLADYNGKVVLIDFWASWCAPCTAEEPYLKAVYDKYANDDRFVLLGMNNDDAIEKAIEHVKAHQIPWRHGFLGGTNTPTNTAYGVQSWPTILLIGRNGQILDRGLRGEGIGAAVEKALAK